MVNNLTLRARPIEKLAVEIVERKGIGHPDTICDALAENLSRNLCRWYLENVGTVLHHNVDKALLRGGSARAVFGGGEVIEPIEIYLAGRATLQAGDLEAPITELAVEGSRQWLKEHLHGLDVQKHVRIHCLVRHGSADLTELFKRASRHQVPRANDTSFGVGYAPASSLELAVLEAGHVLDGKPGAPSSSARGEDTKIMAVRYNDNVEFTVACAMIAPNISDADTYRQECKQIVRDLSVVFDRHGFAGSKIIVNAADEPQNNSYYLTVTGTSAEAGDDGQVGRGNRASGLITPYRAMSLEAVCGKNPVNHVGKLYNIAAREIAARLVEECAMIETAHCCLVSQIGSPITEPAAVDVLISTIDSSPANEHREAIEDIASSILSNLPLMLDRFVNGQVQLY